jgi:hypothetical protein
MNSQEAWVLGLRVSILENLDRSVQEIVVHQMNIITDSEWFSDLVAEKLEQVLLQKTEEEG